MVSHYFAVNVQMTNVMLKIDLEQFKKRDCLKPKKNGFFSLYIKYVTTHNFMVSCYQIVGHPCSVTYF